jgi:hypothetical protein
MFVARGLIGARRKSQQLILGPVTDIICAESTFPELFVWRPNLPPSPRADFDAPVPSRTAMAALSSPGPEASAYVSVAHNVRGSLRHDRSNASPKIDLQKTNFRFIGVPL